LLVLLNYDTLVAQGWLERLERHSRDPEIGLVGAVTNRIGNEAEVEVNYESYGEFLQAAATRAANESGRVFDLQMPAMFCLAVRRDVYERIGPLDEGFGIGTLEDDDYAERVHRLGLRSVGADDVLVHHFGEGSFGRLYASGQRERILERNRRRFEAKWGRAWRPYGRRQTEDYELLRECVRETVATRLPADAAVVVASRGDDELIRFDERRGWHFPQMPNGVYAGHHPADSTDAITQLETLRRQGASHFLIPRTSMWWLDHYPELGSHLSQHYREVVRDEACVVFELNGGPR
jgi:GT2 family glycosyltransferase